MSVIQIIIIVTNVASSSISSSSSFSITSKLVHPDPLQLPQATCRAFYIVLLACVPHIATVSLTVTCTSDYAIMLVWSLVFKGWNIKAIKKQLDPVIPFFYMQSLAIIILLHTCMVLERAIIY